MNETTTTAKTETRHIVKIGNPADSTPTVDYVFYAEKPALEFYHRTKPTNKHVTVIKETVSTETATTTVSAKTTTTTVITETTTTTII